MEYIPVPVNQSSERFRALADLRPLDFLYNIAQTICTIFLYQICGVKEILLNLPGTLEPLVKRIWPEMALVMREVAQGVKLR